MIPTPSMVVTSAVELSALISNQSPIPRRINKAFGGILAERNPRVHHLARPTRVDASLVGEILDINHGKWKQQIGTSGEHAPDRFQRVGFRQDEKNHENVAHILHPPFETDQ